MFTSMLGLTAFIYEINRSHPFFVLIFFIISLIGLLIRLFHLHSLKAGGNKIDFNLLREKNIVRYIPWLKENVRGHSETIDIVAHRIQQNLSLSQIGRTLGSFIFVGPTGTGKTFLSELIGMTLYPNSEPIIISMNQYKSPNDVYTLLGAPPGHPGFEIGGSLTRPIQENPYRLVLIDEIEKAHPDVQHCLYNILDKAESREKSSGNLASFAACVFIATCNSGVESLRNVYASEKNHLLRTARAREILARDAGFERALLARFDDILLMDELRAIDVAEVACLQLAKHWRRYGINVDYASPEIILEAMMRNMEFKEYGVRQLSRFIQELADPVIELARQSGKNHVRLDVDRRSGKIILNA